jgi:hypothetical protein
MQQDARNALEARVYFVHYPHPVSSSLVGYMIIPLDRDLVYGVLRTRFSSSSLPKFFPQLTRWQWLHNRQPLDSCVLEPALVRLGSCDAPGRINMEWTAHDPEIEKDHRSTLTVQSG